jgi:AcrR family transcriptional regulator
MARLSPAERREAIVVAALAVAVRKGLGATTVRDVAAEMGTSSGLIHHYFDSMDEVLAAAFDRAAGQDLANVEEAMDRAESAIGKVRAFFDNYSLADHEWAFQLWLDAWAEASRKPALRATSERLNVTWQQLLATTIKKGRFDCDDPDAASWRILSLLDGLSLQVVAHQSTLARSTVADWIRKYAEYELGLRPGTLGP